MANGADSSGDDMVVGRTNTAQGTTLLTGDGGPRNNFDGDSVLRVDGSGATAGLVPNVHGPNGIEALAAQDATAVTARGGTGVDAHGIEVGVKARASGVRTDGVNVSEVVSVAIDAQADIGISAKSSSKGSMARPAATFTQLAGDAGAIGLTPVATTSGGFKLPASGMIGDVVVMSYTAAPRELGLIAGPVSLWLCVAPSSPTVTAEWAQIALGDRVFGG